MKHFIKYSLFILFIFNAAGAFAQNDTLSIGDTATVNFKGRKVAKTVILLRDSINLSIKDYQTETFKATGSEKDYLKNAVHNLNLYKDRLDLNIDEIFNYTSQKGWSNDLIKRVTASTADVSRGYNQILKSNPKPNTVVVKARKKI